jgi:hypothetical protein
MMTKFASVVLAFMVVFSTWSLRADVALTTVGTTSLDPPIIYTEQAIASGTLGGTTFTDTLITIMLDGDTGNVTGGSEFFSNTVGTFTVNVSGIGTATFTDSMEVFDDQVFAPPAAGFGLLGLNGGSVLDTFNTQFGSYDLTTPIGPISGASFIRPDLFFGTTLGNLNIVSAGDSTFTASTVPEPSLIPLVALGGILACRLKRKPADLQQTELN